MRNYFVRSDGGLVDAHVLERENIVYAQTTVGNYEGFIFDEPSFESVCRLFDLEVRDFSGTSIEGMYEPSFNETTTHSAAQETETEVEVEVDDTAQAAREAEARARREREEREREERETFEYNGTRVRYDALGTIINIEPFDYNHFSNVHNGEEIIFRQCYGLNINAPQTRRYTVWLYARPSTDADFHAVRPSWTTRRELFGHRWSRECDSFMPNTDMNQGDDCFIIHDDQDQPVAQVIGKNIFVLHDLKNFQNAERADFKVLMKIITAAFNKELSEEERERLFQESLASFKTYADQQWQGRRDDYAGRINNAKRQVADYRQRLREAISQQNEYERLVGMLDHDSSERDEMYLREFNRIKNLEKVEYVEFERGQMKIHTRELYCDDNRSGKTHVIGRMEIKVNVGNQDIRWMNKDRTIDGKPHPHVNPSGEACMGNFTEMTPELFARNEFATLIIMCIKFAESVDTNDSWGGRIREWPEKGTV